MRTVRPFVVTLMVLLCANTGWALAGPKVTVTYSMEQRDGGRLVQEITGTALGAGDQILVISTTDDCKGSDPYSGGEICGTDTVSNNGEVWAAGEMLPQDPETGAVPGPVQTSAGDSPQYFRIEYTSDGAGTILPGPVELVDMRWSHTFSVFVAGGLATTTSDIDTKLAAGVTGTYDDLGTITWTGPYATIATGFTNCGGDSTLCSLATPTGGWPRVEPNVTDYIANGNPTACAADRPGLTVPPVPTWTVGGGESTVDTDNGTPDSFQDDMLVNCDNQAINYESWYGVETSRSFTPAGVVPVLAPMTHLLLGGAIAASGGWLALRRARRT